MKLLAVSGVLSIALASAVLGCSGSSASGTALDGGGSGPVDGTAPGQDAAMSGEAGGDSSSPTADSGIALDSSSGFDAGSHDSGAIDSSTGVDGSTGVDAAMEAGVDCGSTPSLHEEEGGTIYCGFGDAGSITCPIGQECCLGGSLGNNTFAPDECATYGSTCTNGTADDAGVTNAISIACMQVSDCAANGVSGAVACCLQGATAPAPVPGCTYPKATHGTAIACETSACAAGEVTICSSQADCPQGTTCTAGKWKIFQMGFCL